MGQDNIYLLQHKPGAHRGKRASAIEERHPTQGGTFLRRFTHQSCIRSVGGQRRIVAGRRRTWIVEDPGFVAAQDTARRVGQKDYRCAG